MFTRRERIHIRSKRKLENHFRKLYVIKDLWRSKKYYTQHVSVDHVDKWIGMQLTVCMGSQASEKKRREQDCCMEAVPAVGVHGEFF
jgi:hypothetical protein